MTVKLRRNAAPAPSPLDFSCGSGPSLYNPDSYFQPHPSGHDFRSITPDPFRTTKTLQASILRVPEEGPDPPILHIRLPHLNTPIDSSHLIASSYRRKQNPPPAIRMSNATMPPRKAKAFAGFFSSLSKGSKSQKSIRTPLPSRPESPHLVFASPTNDSSPSISTPTKSTLSVPLSGAAYPEEKQDGIPSFVRFAKKAVRRALTLTRRKLSSQSPPSELPTTWADYANRYSKNQIDLNDPPLPPSRAANEAVLGTSATPTPFEERVWVAPVPFNEGHRQTMVRELDLFGTRSTTSATTNSLENHPAFRRIVAECRDVFGTKSALITVLDDEKQLFLATGGLPDGLNVLPRSVSFCSHAILNEDRGLVVLDSQKDWRFANALPSKDLGARFYAGVPLFAPVFGNPHAPSIAIGTLCIVDNNPRTSFTEEQREKLRELAAEASLEVEGWVNLRMGGKLSRLEHILREAKTADVASPRTSSDSLASSLSSFQFPAGPAPSHPLPPLPASRSVDSEISEYSESRHGCRFPRPSRRPRPSPLQSPKSNLPPTPPDSLHGRSGSITSVSSELRRQSLLLGRRESDWSRLSISSSAGVASRAASDNAVPQVPDDVQSVFDRAMRMLAEKLSLDLVYLMSLDLVDPACPLTLLAAHGLSSPPPVFHSNLHFKALRAVEGGILYQSKKGSMDSSEIGLASGILIPVLEVRKCGFVLAGYTKDGERELGSTDMKYLVMFAEQLEGWVTRVGRA